MKYLICTFIIAYGLLAHAQDSSTRRVAEIAEGSEFLVQLNDSKLLETGVHEWTEIGAVIKKSCSMKIQSHYDRSQVSGATPYSLSQIQRQNYMHDDGFISDQFTLWLTTPNKDLPLLSLDCHADFTDRRATPNGLTLEFVSALIEQTDFFKSPVFREVPSHLAADFFPRMKTVKLLQALTFEGGAPGSNSGYGVSEPKFNEGQLVTGNKVAPCSVSYHDYRTDRPPYKIVLPAGQEFQFRYSSTTDDSNVMIGFNVGTNYFDLNCFKTEAVQGFEEIQRHIQGFLEFH